ncbi:MAG: NAD(P)/FAD-dependent oxidoreductase [Acidimicrobiales bacterium]
MNGDSYDVVVIGGGAAGLSGALTLARARRSVLVIDAGEPRNAPAAGVHGFLTRDGTSPSELLATGRDEIGRYGAEVVTGRVRGAAADGNGFVVELEGGGTVRARRLLVTTGLVDELPPVPGVRERWGRDVLHCPYCHGWEVRDQAIGVLATGPRSVHQALLFSQWSPDVTFFTHTTPSLAEEQAEELAARNIPVVEGEVVALEITVDGIRGIRLASGTVVPCQAVAVGPRFVARAEPLISLGLVAEEHPMGVGTRVVSDATGLTAVPGVWVAGNVADPMAQVMAAAAGGAAAAGAINFDLIDEEVQLAVAARRGAAAGRG